MLLVGECFGFVIFVELLQQQDVCGVLKQVFN